WAWEDVKPLFIRAESWEAGGSDRGTEGPLSVSPSRVSRRVVDAWVEAAVAAGYPHNPDYNGPDQEGVGHFQLTMRDGKRCSSAVAYLKPARGRQNLEVLTGHQTEQVLIEEGRAVGIRARRGGDVVEIRARAEVILSAGAIGSPHILMHSGIGPGEMLQGQGLETRVEAPGVGRNLQDHLQARPVYKCKASTINTEIRSLWRKGLMALEYAARRTGPMTMAASLGTGFLKTRPELATPDIQFHIQPFSADNPADGPHPFDAFTASVLQLRPESAGHLALASPDPMTPPAIHMNYLATETDCQTLVAGIRIARRIAEFEPLKSLVTAEHAPGPGVDDSDGAILDWARNTAVTIYHPTGTCRMGADTASVVDPALKVRGVAGLRVADCAIMPQIVSGNTNAPAIMIGEKCADLVLRDAGQ
ncbi:MAG: GMC oxidoreductase, partial [Pseudomonadota bacterium]